MNELIGRIRHFLQNLELSCIRGNSGIEVTNKVVDSLTFGNILIQQEFTYLNKCLIFYFYFFRWEKIRAS